MPTDYPSAESYDDVTRDAVTIDVGGAAVKAPLYRPATGGPHPAIVLGQDATGCNAMNRRVAATLAHDGFVVLIPDYYRGSGPDDPESLDDIAGLMSRIVSIDFVAETKLFHAAIDSVKARPDVDGNRVAVWGYCTGGTFAMLAACLRRDLKAAVLYYPSQPRMDPVDDTRPAHPIDLLWNMGCPALMLVGETDVVWPPSELDELRRRAASWNLDMTIATFPGAGHAFSTPVQGFFAEAADRDAWRMASAFVARHLGARS